MVECFLKMGISMDAADHLKEAPLGKTATYHTQYMPSLLFPIPRHVQRRAIHADLDPPFHGIDLWNLYELSWLNLKGKPCVAICEFRVPCTSPCLIESKSLKLYFNSLNQTRFSDEKQVAETIQKDLSHAAEAEVLVELRPLETASQERFELPYGTCLDTLDISTNVYTVDSGLLKCGRESVTEQYYSHLLRSNCLATNQPDWGSVYISYTGPKIDPESLLKYIISFREHREFHEHCIERIYMDLMRHCKPEALTVFGKFTRRGGLDINPFRSNFEEAPSIFSRMARQ